MNRIVAVVLAAPLSCLSAQAAPPVFVPKAVPMAWIRCDGIPELRQQWPNTALGRLFADADIQALVAKFGQRVDRMQEHHRVIFAAASELKVDMPWYEVTNLFAQPDPFRELSAPLAEMRRLEFYATLRMRDDRPSIETTSVISCLPQFEGRWTQEFEREAAALRASPWFREQASAKVGSYDAYRFVPPPAVIAESGERGETIGRWLLHVPGTFVIGTGVPDEVGSIEMSPEQPPAGLAMSLGLKDYLTPFTSGADLPAAIGIEALATVDWRNRIVADQIVEEFEIRLADAVKPVGVVGAILAGGGKLVGQALPEGALAQLRFAIAYQQLLGAIQELAGGEMPLPKEAMADVEKMLDGSVALGVCAPKAGGVIPRIYLTLGIADAAAFDRLLARLEADGLPIKNVTYGGVECSLLKFPGMPQGVQPALCRIENKLHIAESGLSLRDFLKVQDDEVEAMDVGDAKPPAGAGTLVTTVDARFDLAQLYRTYYETWLPLYELAAPQEHFVGRSDMPDPDVVAEHIGAIRGAMYRDGNRYVLRHAGSVGPVLACYLMAWPPMGGDAISDRQTATLAGYIAQHKLRAVWPAFERFEQREGRRPKDLAELFVAEKLADDALLVPLDPAAEDVQLANGKVVRSSFRYFPGGVAVPQVGVSADGMLIELVARPNNRAILAVNGEVDRIYSDSFDLANLGK